MAFEILKIFCTSQLQYFNLKFKLDETIFGRYEQLVFKINFAGHHKT